MKVEASSSAKKSRRRQKKSPPPPPTAVQKLYDTCKEVFAGCGAGIVPPPESVERVRSALDDLKPSDVNLRPTMQYFGGAKKAAKGSTPITYLHLYECDQFSIGIFCLPPSGVIPLHNHPGMTVFSKLLFGSMHIKSYDWYYGAPQKASLSLNSGHSSRSPAVRLAKVVADAVFTTPCDTSILYPAAGGNMHRFTAVTPCAVLDVLGPPYSDEEGRPCTYYRDFAYANFPDSESKELELLLLKNLVPDAEGEANGSVADGEGEGDYAWLEEMGRPKDFTVVGAKYMGPKIVESC